MSERDQERLTNSRPKASTKNTFHIYYIIFVAVVIFLVLIFGNKTTTDSQGSSSTTKKTYSRPTITTFNHESFDFATYETFDFDSLTAEGTYVITYSARLIRNNSVGSRWGYGIKYNGEYIENKTKVEAYGAKVMVVACATEYDDSNDYGQTYIYFDLLDIGEKCTQEVSVIVRENRGRYSGNTAEWIFEITVERIN